MFAHKPLSSTRAFVGSITIIATLASGCGGTKAAPSPAADVMPSDALGMVPLPAGVRVQIETDYYPVTGTSPRAWQVSMSRSAPRAGLEVPFTAKTNWRIKWKYASTRATPAGCGMVAPDVQLTLQYKMPRLVSDSAASVEDRAEWRRYVTSLWAHEMGHARRNVKAASSLREELEHLSVGSCALVAAEAQRLSEAVMAKCRALNEVYDANSRHGARQGATLVTDRRRISVDTSYHDTGS